MLKQIGGDLLTITDGIICHQVNTQGATGGLAGALRRKFPKAFDEYFGEVERGHCAGCAVIGWQTESLGIAHVFGQVYPGSNTDLKLVESALDDLAYQLLGSHRPLYAPQMMGCGLGGGDWTKYSALIEKHLPQTIIVKLP